jgi:hypothetical protein
MAAASGFDDCFIPPSLERFWAEPSYTSSNPNIITIFFYKSYSFAFDNSTSSLGLGSIALANGSEFLSSVPTRHRAALSGAAAYLSQARAESEKAKEAQVASHVLFSKAKDAMHSLFGHQGDSLANIFLAVPLSGLKTLLQALDISNYIVNYPNQYSATLEHASAAYEFSYLAADSLSQLVQSEYDFLSRAGAGSPLYSGKASLAFNFAESMLSPKAGFCQDKNSPCAMLPGYFSSSPQMPDFSPYGFSNCTNLIAGKGKNSSMSQMLSLYLDLIDAKEGMLLEYESADADAQSSLRSLSLEVSLLESERLEMIGDLPSSQNPASGLLVGSGYSGIYSGFLSAKDDQMRAQSALSSSKAIHSSKGADAWLANSIFNAKLSSEISKNALASLGDVRINAVSAVEARKQEAMQAISKAQTASSGQASNLPSANSLSSSRIQLARSEEEFSSAQSSNSLGEAFSLYTSAAKLAHLSISLSQDSQGAGLALEASQAISTQSSLLASAKQDLLDVSYEKDLLSEYGRLIANSPSQDIYSAVILAIEQDRQNVLLRLSESYSYLNEKYAAATRLSSEMHISSPEFSQRLGKLSKYFPSGSLDPSAAAGNLARIDSELDAIIASEEAQIPEYLSSLLSQNAQINEVFSTPVLGKIGSYAAYVTTENPSGLSYASSLPFSIHAILPLYSIDLAGGDKPYDAYPENGRTSIVLPSVAARQAFYFEFKKDDSPAQITSATDSCGLATEESASLQSTISFVSSRQLPLLQISLSSPISSYDGTMQYGRQTFPLGTSIIGNESALEGEITHVLQGKGGIKATYRVRYPFSISSSDRVYEQLPLGSKRVSYTVTVLDPKIDCSSAEVRIFEPFTGISNFSIVPLSGSRIQRLAALPLGSETELSFSFSPLSKVSEARFLLSYTVSDQNQALSDALSQAEILVLTYNRTKDYLALAEAKSLASQGRPNDAMSVLSQMRKDAQTLSYSAGDYLLYLQEKSESDAISDSLASTQEEAIRQNSSSSEQISQILFKYRSSASSASDEADSGSYQKALSILRKAKGESQSSLASLSLSLLSEASDEYAKARKEKLERVNFASAQGWISSAQAAYSKGEFEQAIISSSMAISTIATNSSAASDQASSESEKIWLEYASLHNQAESLLASYTTHYSALTTQNRRGLPFTPSAAQARLDEADKLLAASKKASLPPNEMQSQANSSFAKLSALHASLSSALSALAGTAASSLQVARAALAEANLRANQDDAKQISREVSRAEEYLSRSMYADSIASSDRAIRAANSALAKTYGASPLQPFALAAASILFIGAAAYFFFKGKKRAPEAKKEVPKAE